MEEIEFKKFKGINKEVSMARCIIFEESEGSKHVTLCQNKLTF